MHQLSPSATPEECANRLAQGLPLQRLEALTSPSEWWHRDGVLLSEPLPLAASHGSPVHLEIARHTLQWLILVHDGEASVVQDPHQISLQVGDGVILPGLPWSLITQPSSLTILGFDPLQVMGAARAIAPSGWTPPPAAESPLGALLPLQRQQDLGSEGLLDIIALLLPSIHKVSELGDGFLDRFLMRQQLLRLMATLIFPEVRDGQGSAPLHPANRDARLDRVVDYIQTHLHESLPMSVLEAESHYSRRTLHYAFQQRYGCSPLQWIRQQRMALALKLLQNPLPGDTLKTISQKCGYGTLNRFNTDFERTFECRPAAVLRQHNSLPLP